MLAKRAEMSTEDPGPTPEGIGSHFGIAEAGRRSKGGATSGSVLTRPAKRLKPTLRNPDAEADVRSDCLGVAVEGVDRRVRVDAVFESTDGRQLQKGDESRSPVNGADYCNSPHLYQPGVNARG